MLGGHKSGRSPLEHFAETWAQLLLLDTHRWIHRRVERVEFTETDLAHWQFSVDFTVPVGLKPFQRRLAKPDIFFLPIALLRKWPPLMKLDIRSEEGRSVPLLTSEKNRRVDAAALAGLARYAGDTSSELVNPLMRIAHATSKERAARRMDCFVDALLSRTERMSDDQLVRWLRVLRVATSLGENSLLWARVGAIQEQRQIVKVGFDRILPRPARRWRFLPELAGESIELELPNLGERESYHLEFTPPPGTDVIEARLEITDPIAEDADDADRLGLQAQGNGTKKRFGRQIITPSDEIPANRIPYSLNLLSRAYFYIAESSGQSGRALLKLAPARQGFLHGAAYASVITAALLWIVWWWAPALTEPRHQGPTLTALVLLPALLSYLFAQPLPHPIARRRITGIRLLTRIATLLPVAAGLIMLSATLHTKTGQPDVDYIQGWWLLLAVTATALAIALLAGAFLFPRAAVGERYEAVPNSADTDA
jgi:hypothetical protein